MALIKKTKSGKAVMFIDERGYVYTVSTVGLRNMLYRKEGKSIPSIAPWRMDHINIPKSKVYIDGELWSIEEAAGKDLLDPTFYNDFTEAVVGRSDYSHKKEDDKVNRPDDFEIDW